MNPLISIIVPIYNVERYLDRCIQSIVTQSYQKLEILLIDDGSTDQCGVICDKWAKNDDRIQVIHKKNGGLSDARNVGIAHAKGEYLCFIDSDDYIEQSMIQVLYENLNRAKADISMCEFKRQLEGQDEPFSSSEEVRTFSYGKDEILKLLYKNEFVNQSSIVVAWNKLYKKNIFDEIQYPVGRLHEDECIIHQLLYNADKLVYTTQTLYHYMQRENSIMATFSHKRIWDTLYAYEQRIDFFLQKAERDQVRYAYYEWIHKARKGCALCKAQKPEGYRQIVKELKAKEQGMLLKMRKEYIIVGMRFWKEFIKIACS